jgi:GNAT superfamily N-acetyltransferase
MRKRFLTHPDELQTALKKVKTSVSCNSPSISLQSILSFVFISTVEEFDKYLAEPKHYSHCKLRPDLWPPIESEEKDAEDLVYGYESLSVTVLCDTKGLGLFVSVSAKAVGEVSMTTGELVDRMFKHFPEIDKAAVQNPSVFRKSLNSQSLRELITPMKQDEMIVLFSDSDKSTCIVDGITLTLPSETSARVMCAISNFQFLYQFYAGSCGHIDTTDPRFEVFLYFQGSKVVGFLSYHKYFINFENFKVQIQQLFVLPSHQKKGIGSELLRHLYTTFISNDHCKLITAKDPTPIFTRMQLLQLTELAIRSFAKEDVNRIFEFLTSQNLTDIQRLEQPSIENRLGLSLKVGQGIISKVIDVLIYRFTKSHDRKAEFLLYLRSKIRHKIDRESARRFSKETKKFLVFQGVEISPEDIKETLECFLEMETPDINSIFQEQLQAFEAVAKHINLDHY